RRLVSLVLPTFSHELLSLPVALPLSHAVRLQAAITEKLGVPYRFYGTDQRGYDCSGFVWRVFQDVGVRFERLPARDLWDDLPTATAEETRQFGTLVFFNGLKH